MLDNIIKFSIKNKLFITVMTLLLIIWGIWSATKLPIDAQPDITNNQVQVITHSPSLAGQEVEQLVTFPLEQSIVNIPDIEEIRSISRFGLSVITIVFKEKVDIYFARQLVSEKLKEAVEKIPDGIGSPTLAPVSTGLGEVYQYILHPKKGSEDKYSAMDLREMQDWIVARQLYGTPGIAEINSFGGLLKQYEVAIDPNRLKALNITIPELYSAIENNNQNTGGAYIDKKPNAYFIRGIGLVGSLEDIGNISIKNSTSGIPVFVKDVANVQLGSAIRYGALTYNGEIEAVGGVVMMLKGSNANEVVNLVKEKIPTIQKSLPDDIVIEPYLDRTDLVGRAIQTAEKNLIEGALIVIFILVLFLGNFRAGIIVASAIPLSMLFALGLMNLFGVSANLMSLGAIDFGLIVDGSVIVVEATIHHLGLRKSSIKMSQAEMDEEVYKSASKIRTSAAFGEIIILIVYIPILTLVGIEGKLFAPMALTVSFAILGALILSFTYIPMMSTVFLPKIWTGKRTFSDKMMDVLYNLYRPMLDFAIRFKYAVVATTVFIFACSLLVFNRMGAEFLPTLKEGDFAFHCILPQGTSLNQSIETSMLASRIIKSYPEVKMVVGKTGSAEVPTDPMPPEATDLMIILHPQKDWKTSLSYDELADDMMKKLSVIPGVFFEKNQPIQMRFNELMTGIRQDVAVKIYGENLDSLLFYANKVSSIVQQVSGATKPQVERVAGLPQINIEYNRVRLANYGLNITDINTIVSTAFAGKAAGQVYENERRFDLVLRLDTSKRSSIDDVSNLFIPLKNGEQIPLSQVADINYKLGPAQISREHGKRTIFVGFNVSGRDVASVVEDIQQKLATDIKLPTGYYFTFGGQFENLQKASDRLLIAVPISLLLIFILLYFTFHSFKEASLVFLAIPMSAIGGIFALLLRGMPFSISAGVGFIALFGIAVLNGIVLITTFNRLEKDGMKEVIPRILEGTKLRLRPVLMTAMVASLGFLPMAISTGAGAEVQKPLATVVIAGLISATFLTLFVLPVLYLLLASKMKLKPSKTVLTICIFAIGLLGSNTAMAQQSLTVDEAIAIALKNNQRIRSKVASIDASVAQIKTASELEKINIASQYGQFNSDLKDLQFSVSQTVPFPTVFGAKRRSLEAQAIQQIYQKEWAENELIKQIRSAYERLIYIENTAQKLATLETLYADFVKSSRLRYETGDTKKIDILSAETKFGELRMRREQNEVDKENTVKTLKFLMQSDIDFEVVSKSYEPKMLAVLLDTVDLKNHPQIKSLYQEMIILEKNIKLEKSLAMPDLNVTYSNHSLIGGTSLSAPNIIFNRSNRFHYGQVGVAFPISFGATRAKIKTLDHNRVAAQYEAIYQTNELTLTLKNALIQYQQFLRKHAYFKEQALPNVQAIVDASQLGYKAGEISYVEYLFALETATNVELDYLQNIQDLNQQSIEINSIITR